MRENVFFPSVVLCQYFVASKWDCKLQGTSYCYDRNCFSVTDTPQKNKNNVTLGINKPTNKVGEQQDAVQWSHSEWQFTFAIFYDL